MLRLKRAAVVLAVAAATAATACNDVLSVSTPNNPDRSRILSLPRDVEALSSKLYQLSHAAHFGREGAGNDNLDNQLRVSSFENASVGLSNFGMSARSAIPRAFIDNVPGGASATGNRRDFRELSIAAGTAMTIFERIKQPGFTLGTTAAAEARLRSFTWFGYGVALGDLALGYDSAGIPLEGVDPQRLDSLPLVAYDSVMRTALRALDSAEAYSATSSALGRTWLAQANDLPVADYRRIIRSYKARFRANVARTPAERAAVNWAQVRDDAAAGITTDFTLQLIPSGGWDYVWLVQHFVSNSWHNMTPYIIGMADSSGAYDTWLSGGRDGRQPILIQTLDRRFPAGGTQAAQATASPLANGNINAKPYFRTRTSGETPTGASWALSMYEHIRWRTLQQAVRVGPWITFSKVENDMLRAEALLRTGDTPGAIALINVSRTANNLPAIPASTPATSAVPGGRACVPRVPDAAQAYVATKCGDVFEAMKWEKRMESAFAGFSVWYFDSRGWGDLPLGTAVHWPVPYQELDSRLKPTYFLGGASGTGARPGGSAPSTTYGFGIQN